jgi:hypothetical protein
MLTPNYRYGDYPRMGAAKMSCGQGSPFKVQKSSLIAKLIHQEQTHRHEDFKERERHWI